MAIKKPTKSSNTVPATRWLRSARKRALSQNTIGVRSAHRYAEIKARAIGASAIYIGAVAEDSSGYPDCRPEYYRVFQELIRVGTRPETQIEMVTPVIALKKNEIVRRGIELGAPLHLTWSCYQSDEEACGVCDSCLLRLRAFSEAGVPDPIPYRRGRQAAPAQPGRSTTWN